MAKEIVVKKFKFIDKYGVVVGEHLIAVGRIFIDLRYGCGMSIELLILIGALELAQCKSRSGLWVQRIHFV